MKSSSNETTRKQLYLRYLKEESKKYDSDSDDPGEQQQILRLRNHYQTEIQRVAEELRQQGKSEGYRYWKIVAVIVALHVVVIGASSIARGMQGFGVSIGILLMVWLVRGCIYAFLS